ncbi:hypothetical protein F8388_006686 [Cannabis sativa]|uniref:Glycosyl transferase CAP10 domain-containing protein n=1 Tax=Cannabis sativa TaxID=3483 RepID=A0A7J6GV90_CANSA|nr:hypothetical protein F8388_006686 [Cannabis sativa]KAF4392851.1 hypothetical protein G4B88_011846 [Cannabis sativa]
MKRSNDQKGSGTGLFNESSSSEIVVLHDTGGNRWLRPVSKKKAVAAIAPAVILIVFIFFSFSLVIMLPAGWINVSNNENARLIKTTTCPRNYTYSSTSWSSLINPSRPAVSNTTTTVSTCPSYFRWIHEDLGHWKESGITKEMVERAQRTAHFRLVIVEGKAYVKKYRKSLQSRDMFSIWGILQLLRFYPGRLPDLELMFDCNDRPVVRMRDFRAPNPRPPPLFRYCSDRWSMDIVFPDWSFWGWAECNIKPWKNVLADIKEGNNRTKWKDRVPYAYWRGNPYVAPTRRDLLKCNVSQKNDWNTRIYIQSWEEEKKQGYKKSNLEDQCTHRYKIYTEGWAWSVSEKYILACDSMALYIKSRYHDFYIRGMQPLQHYWPIRENTKCTSLKFAVDWGNNHTHQAEAMGKEASKFIEEEMKMEYVYDYMFHLLNEYAKLFKYKPTIPAGAEELSAQAMLCQVTGTWRNFMVESMVNSPSDSIPCSLPPNDPQAISQLHHKRDSSIRQVEFWENEYWQKQSKPK